jgi:signal transduction histidine kinase
MVAYNASVYKDQKGNVVGAFAAARDITERERAEQELRETVKRLEEYTNRINNLVVTMLGEIAVK